MTSNINFTKGLIFSLLVHAAAFIYWHTDFNFKSDFDVINNNSRDINIQLVKFIQPAKPIVNKKSITKKSIKQNSEKEISQIVKNITKKTQTIKKKLITDAKKTPKPVQPNMNTEKSIQDKKALEQEKRAELAAQQLLANLIKEERENYIKRLLAHIESFKFYPRAARKRAIEGRLNITFLLLREGDIKKLNITGGVSILQRAVQQALRDSLPLPKPPPSIENHELITFNMVFELEQT